jgi:predicted MFS family arabinose efflux permease
MVPALVPAANLARANARIELARTCAFAAGPALAGVLVGWIGAEPAFAVAALCSAGAASLLAGLREPARAARAPRHPLHDLREGAVFVFRHPLLLPVFLTQFIFGVAFFMLQAVYVPYAAGRLGLSAAGIGLTLAAYGAGMIVGALAAPRIMRRLRFGLVAAIGPVTGFAAALIMASTIWLPSAWLAGTSFFLMGAGPILWVISTTTLRQSVTPPDLLGRASAINTLAYGARPLGAALGALLGGLWGAETCLAAAAAGFLVQAALILLSPVCRLSRQPALAG